MAKFWSKDIRVYLGGYDISQSQVRLAVTMQAEALDPTSFPDAAERVLPGVRRDSLEWAGIFDDQATGATADMYAAATAILGTATAGTLVTVLVGTGAGSVAFVGTALLNSKKVGSSVTDLVRIGVDFAIDGSWRVATNGTARINIAQLVPFGLVDNGASSTNGGTWFIHIFNLSGGSSGTLTFRHGTSTGTMLTIGTISFTGRDAQTFTAAGTVYRFTDYFTTATGTNSVDIQVAFIRL